MPIIAPARLDQRITQLWYHTDAQMHQPVIKWLNESEGVRKHIETFCNKLVEKNVREAVQREVPARTMFVKISINLKKATSIFWNNLPEQVRPKVDVQMLQAAIEMIFEDAGYAIEHGILTHEVNIPPLQAKAESVPATKAPKAAPLAIPTEKALSLPVHDDEDVAEEEEEASEEGEAEEEESGEEEGDEEEGDEEEDSEDGNDEEEDDEELEEAPIVIGGVYSNENGTHRKVVSIADGKVEYLVTQGSGRIKEGQEGKMSYKGFLNWISGVVS